MVINNLLKLPINHLLPLTKWVWQWRQLFQLHMCICKWNPNLREVWWLEKSLVAWLQMLSRAFNNSTGEYSRKVKAIATFHQAGKALKTQGAGKLSFFRNSYGFSHLLKEDLCFWSQDLYFPPLPKPCVSLPDCDEKGPPLPIASQPWRHPVILFHLAHMLRLLCGSLAETHVSLSLVPLCSGGLFS